MTETRTYTRKISAKEAREGCIMISADRLSMFPEVGQSFPILFGSKNHTVEVESEPCTGRGEDEPHQHYHIHWPGLKAGDEVTIECEGGRYRLRVEN